MCEALLLLCRAAELLQRHPVSEMRSNKLVLLSGGERSFLIPVII